MKRILAGVLALLLAGCDYTVALVDTPTIRIDGAILGLWERTTPDGETERMLVLPMNEREVLVAFPAGSENAMYARTCLWQGAGMTLAQLDWIGNARGSIPDDGRSFQYASYAVKDDEVRIRMLNPDVVSNRISNRDELVKAIGEAAADPDLFHDERVFRKVPEPE